MKAGVFEAIDSPDRRPSANKINDTDVINHLKYFQSHQSNFSGIESFRHSA
jgi:hypothetical protein